MDKAELGGIIEAILFVAGEPVQIPELAHALNMTESEMNEAVDALRDTCDLERRGIQLNRYGSTVQLSTRAVYNEYIERFLQPVTKQSLSQAVMETLSIIAYRQPVTRSEIESVRGVKCDYSVQLLLSRGLIAEAGQRETLGRPMQYATTDAFLRHFGLESLDDLPDRELGRGQIPLTERSESDETAH